MAGANQDRSLRPALAHPVAECPPAEGEEDEPPPPLDLSRVFPWLAPTRISDKGLATTPQDV